MRASRSSHPPVGPAPAVGRRSRRLVLGGIGSLALLAACSCSKTDNAATPSSSAAPGVSTAATEPSTTTTAAPAPTYPLRGTPIDDPAKAQRAALVVKIDNVDSLSRPQAGINQADIIWEEKIEGPISRFAAVFHSTDAPELGPVRSGRSTDVAIVSTLNHPLYAFSGANAVFIKRLREAPLIDIGYDIQPKSYDRKPGRKAPDNVFTSSDRLWALSPAGTAPPPAQFTYRVSGSPLPASAVPVTSFNYDFGGGPVGQPVTFTWDAGKGGWARQQKGTPHVDAAGVQVAPTNVIVRFTPYHDTGLVDLSNTPVPEAELDGTGDAWVFIEGKAIKATWSKPDDTTVTTYTAADGTPIALDPGQTWIALVPTGGDFTGTKADGTPLG